MTDDDDRAGLLVLGRFRLQRRIGGGAMGDVYVASHEGLGRLVAVKILRSSARPASRARFRREATIAARLTGAHVVRVTDFGELADGAPFLVMDYVDGPTLAAELAARGPLPITEAVGRCLEVCEALAEAHGAGIVHRDIKPANLLLARSPDGSRVLRVADFGVAKAEGESTLTGDGASLGSPSYMAPEQIVDPHGVDARADIWAVGVVLFELLAGERPFDGPTVPATLMAVAQASPPRVDAQRTEIPVGLAAIVERCLSKDPRDRYDSAASLAEALAPFGPADASVVAARVRRVSASALTQGNVTLDPDAPTAPAAAPPNATTVTGGVTASRLSAPLALTTGSPQAGAKRLAWPLGAAAVLGVVLAAAWLPRTTPPAPAPPSSTADASGVLSARPEPTELAAPVAATASEGPPSAGSAAAIEGPGVPKIAAHAGTARAGRASRAGAAASSAASLASPPPTAPPAAATGAPTAPRQPPTLTTEVDDLGPRK